MNQLNPFAAPESIPDPDNPVPGLKVVMPVACPKCAHAFTGRWLHTSAAACGFPLGIDRLHLDSNISEHRSGSRDAFSACQA